MRHAYADLDMNGHAIHHVGLVEDRPDAIKRRLVRFVVLGDDREPVVLHKRKQGPGRHGLLGALDDPGQQARAEIGSEGVLDIEKGAELDHGDDQPAPFRCFTYEFVESLGQPRQIQQAGALVMGA